MVIILLVFVVLGPLITGLGAFFVLWQRGRGIVVQATVTEVRKGKRSGQTVWRPAVKFATPQGEQVTAHLDPVNQPDAVEVGDTVRFQYDPANPKREIDDFPRAVGRFLMGFGVLWCLVVAAVFVIPLLHLHLSPPSIHVSARTVLAGVAVLLLLAGIGFVVLGVRIPWGAVAFQRRAAKTKAEVTKSRKVDSVERTQSNGGSTLTRTTTYYTTFRYRAGDGEEYSIEVQTWREYDKGEEALVAYDPERPNNVRVAGFPFSSFLSGAALVFLGCIVGFFGSIFFVSQLVGK